MVDMNCTDSEGRTPLHLVSKDHTKVLQILLGHQQVDVNHIDNVGKTPLDRAVQEGHAGVVQILLADPRVQMKLSKTEPGNTPLHRTFILTFVM